MQPRRDTEYPTYEDARNTAGEGTEQEDAYQPVKPVGYEARLAFEQERASGGRPGQAAPGPSGRQHTGAPVYGPAAPYASVRRPGPSPIRGQAPFTGTQPVMRPPVQGTVYRQPAPGNTQPYPPAQGAGAQPAPPPDYQETRPEDLLRERSPELMEKRGDFWKPVGEKPKAAPKDKSRTVKPKARPKPRRAARPRKNHVFRGLLMFLAVAFGVGMLVRSVLFSVRAAQVSGNVQMTEAEVLSVAGISLGENMFELDEAEIARRINANHYLSFQRLRLDWPDGVTLFVTERVPSAYTNAYGMLYILAEDGTVLEDSNDIDALPDLPLVQGFQEGDVVVGRKIAADGSDKLITYTALMEELQTQEYLIRISVLNISDVDNIFLVTTDGYTVQMGNRDDIRAKVGAMRAVVDKLKELGNEGGTINISDDPVHPTYMP